jgi:tetratricopeptide (TPR) repeat protein
MLSTSLMALGQTNQLVLQGEQYYKEGKFDKVILRLEPNIHELTNDTQALWLLAESYRELSLYSNALEYYQLLIPQIKYKEIARINRARSTYLSNDYYGAEKYWKELANDYPNEIMYWYGAGIACYKAQKFSEAEKYANKALKIDSSDYNALFLRSESRLKLSNYIGALADTDSCLKIQQYNNELILNRGMCLIGLKRYKEAEQMFKRMLTHDAKNKTGLFGLGETYYGMKRYADAVEQYNQCLEAHPNFELAVFKKGLAYLSMDEKVQGCHQLTLAAELGYAEAISYLQKHCGWK